MRAVRAACLGVALVGLLAATAAAAPITPTFTTFGTLTGATFGGTGIPNHAVAITTVETDILVLGLTAHQRFVGPNLVNDGAGTFQAFTGVSTFPPSPGDPYATWNFGWYIGGGSAIKFAYKLLYDLDPAVGTDEANHKVFGPLVPQIIQPQPGFPQQDSWNLGMNFLESPDVFNPNVPGEYTFALIAYEVSLSGPNSTPVLGDEVARSAIRVNVPEPATLLLLGLGLVAAGRRLRRQ